MSREEFRLEVKGMLTRSSFLFDTKDEPKAFDLIMPKSISKTQELNP
jgi:hypothetical protein